MNNIAFDFSNTARLKSNLNHLDAVLRSHGVNSTKSASISFDHFSRLGPAEQQTILTNISTYLQILAQDAEPEIKPSRNPEVARLKSALGAFGLRTTDGGFFDLVKTDDIVEIYSHTGVQLYRNVNFCKICSYSLLDLAVNPWDELYEKPASITNRIHKLVAQVLSGGDATIPYDLASFVQREKFIYAKTRRTFHVTPKFLSPLRDEFSGRITGFLSTHSATVIAEGADSEKFNIL